MKLPPSALVVSALLLGGCAVAAPEPQTQDQATLDTVLQDTAADEGSLGADTTTATGAVAQAAGRLTPLGLLELGDANASHSVLIFLTPGSNYSAQFVRELLPALTSTYVANGKVKLEIAFVPFVRYPSTANATAALLCAAREKKGGAALVALAQDPNAALVKTLSLTKQTFDSCMKEPAIADAVKRHAALASSLNVTLVPTMFLDGTKSVGLPEWSDLNAAINALLSN